MRNRRKVGDFILTFNDDNLGEKSISISVHPREIWDSKIAHLLSGEPAPGDNRDSAILKD